MLITILVVLLILALAIWAVQLLPIDRRLLIAIQIVMIVIAIVYIANAAGLG